MLDDDKARFISPRSLEPGKEAGERLQRRFRGMVLHAFRVGFGGLGGDAYGKQ